MATINYTSEYDLAGGYVKVEWSGLSAGDDGQSFDCAGLRLASIHYWGSLNGGHVTVRASNEISAANFVDIHDNTVPGMQFQISTGVNLPFMGAVSPIADGSVSSAGVTMLFVTP